MFVSISPRPSEIRSRSSGGGGDGTSSGRRKRAKTEKRAAQNRAAQKRYREKLKSRHGQLEDFARRRGFDPDQARPALHVEPDWSDSLLESSSASEISPQVDNRILHGPADPEPWAAHAGLQGTGPRQAWPTAMMEMEGSPYPDFMLRSPAELVPLLEESGSPTLLILDTDKILAEYDLRALTSTSELLCSRSRLLLQHIFYVLDLRDRDSNADLVQLVFSQGLSLRQMLVNGVQQLLESTNNDCTRRYDPFARSLANPFTNHLRIKRFATLDAIMSNAMALGYHIPDLYTARKPSLFYRPEVRRVADLKGELAASFMRMPPHLRPTSLQIQRSHKPYIDLLPFPALRMRIIAATMCDPPLVDEYALKTDILHDGLMFWCDGKPSAGMPWDMQSWEVAPWFQRKWGPILFPEEQAARDLT